MQPQIKSNGALLPILSVLLLIPIVAVTGATHECTLEKRQQDEVCVFRNVLYRANDSNFVFKAPTSAKVQHVAFEDSTLNHIPREFLSAFPDLRALTVVQVNLSSVVIPSKLERLYASNNRISKVIVHQTKDNTAMLELMLDSNQLSDIRNLTRLAKLEILNLGGNRELPVEDTVDLGRFRGLDALRHLVLSDVDMLYVENEENVALPALELLDLSNNNLITTNLRVQVFAPLKQLQTLRLSHTLISDLEALQLTQNNPGLKTVYLEGNNFKCDRQRQIVEQLHRSGIATPVSQNARCMQGFEKRDEMCCQSSALNNLLPPVSGPDTRPKAGEDEATTLSPTPTVARATTTASSPSTVAPRGETMSKDNSAATLVTLGSGMLSLTFVTIVKLALF
uniref:Uncharacterized protein n=1 Tax=Anopheles atroparvus TaxID=41427 RepID=A0A182JLV0_ANOAO